MHNRLVAYKLPNVFVKRTEFLLNLQELLSICYCSTNLQSVSYYAIIIKESTDIFLRKLCDYFWLEVLEGFPHVLPLLQNNFPVQTSLHAIKNNEFEEL